MAKPVFVSSVYSSDLLMHKLLLKIDCWKLPHSNNSINSKQQMNQAQFPDLANSILFPKLFILLFVIFTATRLGGVAVADAGATDAYTVLILFILTCKVSLHQTIPFSDLIQLKQLVANPAEQKVVI